MREKERGVGGNRRWREGKGGDFHSDFRIRCLSWLNQLTQFQLSKIKTNPNGMVFLVFKSFFFLVWFFQLILILFFLVGRVF